MSRTGMAALGLAGLIALGGLAGCSDNVDPTTEATQMFCSSADEASMGVADLQQMLAGDAGPAELRAQAESVKTALADTAQKAQGLQQAVDSQLQAARQTFEDALAAIGDSAGSLEEAKAQAKTAAQEYLAALERTKSDLGCGA